MFCFSLSRRQIFSSFLFLCPVNGFFFLFLSIRICFSWIVRPISFLVLQYFVSSLFCVILRSFHFAHVSFITGQKFESLIMRLHLLAVSFSSVFLAYGRKPTKGQHVIKNIISKFNSIYGICFFYLIYQLFLISCLPPPTLGDLGFFPFIASTYP